MAEVKKGKLKLCQVELEAATSRRTMAESKVADIDLFKSLEALNEEIRDTLPWTGPGKADSPGSSQISAAVSPGNRKVTLSSLSELSTISLNLFILQEIASSLSFKASSNGRSFLDGPTTSAGAASFHTSIFQTSIELSDEEDKRARARMPMKTLEEIEDEVRCKRRAVEVTHRST